MMLRRNADVVALVIMVLAFWAARAWRAHEQAREAAAGAFDSPRVWMIQAPGDRWACPDLSGLVDGLRP